VTVGERVFEVAAHAGPWPVEERWWDPARRRRVARLQVLVRPVGRGDEAGHVLLLVLESGAWSLLARYD
jgi:protein ImuB